MEYLEFGDLSKFIKSEISEVEVKEITENILRGLQVMHEEKYAHRDIKPKNILVVEKRPEFPRWRVKIADFGISKQVLEGSNTALHSQVGTIGYCAPEVHGYGYGKQHESFTYSRKVDMWSLGCVLFEISSQGHPPFRVPGPDLDRYCDGTNALNWMNLPTCLSDDGVSFVKALLQVEPESRPTAAEALQDRWFTTVNATRSNSNSTIPPKSDSIGRQNYNSFLSTTSPTDTLLDPDWRDSIMRAVTPVSVEMVSQTKIVAQRKPIGIRSKDKERHPGRYHTARPFPGKTTENKPGPGPAKVSSTDRTAMLDGGPRQGISQQHKLTANTNAPSLSASSDTTQGEPQSGENRLSEWLQKNKHKVLQGKRDGETLLSLAASQGQLEVAKKSVNQGADVHTKANGGWTPLHYAAYRGQLEVVKWLVVEQRADVDTKTIHGQTPLHCAAYRGRLEVVKWLVVEQHADVDTKTTHGWTPLHCAVCGGQLEVVKWLVLKQHANVHTKDKDDRTPLYIAGRYGRPEVAKWLEKQEAALSTSTRWKKKLFGWK